MIRHESPINYRDSDRGCRHTHSLLFCAIYESAFFSPDRHRHTSAAKLLNKQAPVPEMPEFIFLLAGFDSFSLTAERGMEGKKKVNPKAKGQGVQCVCVCELSLPLKLIWWRQIQTLLSKNTDVPSLGTTINTDICWRLAAKIASGGRWRGTGVARDVGQTGVSAGTESGYLYLIEQLLSGQNWAKHRPEVGRNRIILRRSRYRGAVHVCLAPCLTCAFLSFFTLFDFCRARTEPNLGQNHLLFTFNSWLQSSWRIHHTVC